MTASKSNALFEVAENSQGTAPSIHSDNEMTVEEYMQWVDLLVSRAESLEKARQHSPSKTL